MGKLPGGRFRVSRGLAVEVRNALPGALAAHAPLDHIIASDLSYHVSIRLGPNAPAGDHVRRWLFWLKQDDDDRVLYDAAPSAGCRREAEADDHGEVGDPLDRDGPGLLLKVEVPGGVHRMSLYLLSPNGHDTGERNRDYVIEVKPWQGNLKDLDAAPALARARASELWTGVWKQFVVSGPATYGVFIRRNASFNTILPGIFLDKLAGPKSKYDGSRAAWLPVPIVE